MNISTAKSLSLTLIAILLSSCSSVRETQIDVASGNYDYAINRALEGLKRNRSNKKTDGYARILEEALAKAVDRDLRAIERWGLKTMAKLWRSSSIRVCSRDRNEFGLYCQSTSSELCGIAI